MIESIVKQQTHYIYRDKEEFRRFYPKEDIVPWRDCTTEGDWVETDDGQICEVLRIGFFNDKCRNKKPIKYVRTPIGTFLVSQRMDGAPRRNKFSLFNRDGHRIKRFTKKDQLVALYIAKGLDPKDAVQVVYKMNDKQARGKMQRLFNNERFVKYMSEKLEEVLGELGITKRYILEGVRAMCDKDETADSVRMTGYQWLGKLIGLGENNQPPRLPAGFDMEYLEEMKVDALPPAEEVKPD